MACSKGPLPCWKMWLWSAADTGAGFCLDETFLQQGRPDVLPRTVLDPLEGLEGKRIQSLTSGALWPSWGRTGREGQGKRALAFTAEKAEEGASMEARRGGWPRTEQQRQAEHLPARQRGGEGCPWCPGERMGGAESRDSKEPRGQAVLLYGGTEQRLTCPRALAGHVSDFELIPEGDRSY